MPFCQVFEPSVQIYQNFVVGRTVKPGMGFFSYYKQVSFYAGPMSEKGCGNQTSANQTQNSHLKLYFLGVRGLTLILYIVQLYHYWAYRPEDYILTVYRVYVHFYTVYIYIYIYIYIYTHIYMYIYTHFSRIYFLLPKHNMAVTVQVKFELSALWECFVAHTWHSLWDLCSAICLTRNLGHRNTWLHTEYLRTLLSFPCSSICLKWTHQTDWLVAAT